MKVLGDVFFLEQVAATEHNPLLPQPVMGMPCCSNILCSLCFIKIQVSCVFHPQFSHVFLDISVQQTSRDEYGLEGEGSC